MAFEAEVGVPDRQQLGVDRTVGDVADGATFAQRLVLEDVGAALGRVAANATVVFRKQRRAAARKDGSLVGEWHAVHFNLPSGTG